jgi:hypothetical protein
MPYLPNQNTNQYNHTVLKTISAIYYVNDALKLFYLFINNISRHSLLSLA